MTDTPDDPAARLADRLDAAAPVDLAAHRARKGKPKAGKGEGPSKREVANPVAPPADGSGADMMLIGELAKRDQTDTDNAHRLIAHFGRDMLVRRQEGGRAPLWVSWTGTHWDDAAGRDGVMKAAQKVGDLVKLEALCIRPTEHDEELFRAAREIKARPPEDWTTTDKDTLALAEKREDALAKRRAKRIDFGASCKNTNRLDGMIKQAAPHLSVAPEAFNADPLKVATITETLVFARVEDPDSGEVPRWRGTVTVVPGHDRADRITRVLPQSFKGLAAPAPRWRAFVERFLPDRAVRDFVQTTFGLGLLGLTEQILVFHYGAGANGKSVALEVVSRVLGDLAVSLPAESISGDGARGGAQASPDIARLFGARLCRVAEIPEGVRLQEEVVKRLTGGERFPVRNLFEGFFEFDPRFIAHMSGNGKPGINGTDQGIWRRIAVVPWTVTVPVEERRNFTDVVDEFLAEREGILGWLAEGACRYLAEGLRRPDPVIEATAEYRGDQDIVGAFFDACVERCDSDAYTVTGGELYVAFQEWASASGARDVGATRFGRDAARRARKDRGRVVRYVGIALREDRPRNPHGGRDDDR